MYNFLLYNLIWTHGFYILLGTLAFLALSYFINRWLFYLGLAFLVFTLYFFRNPDRSDFKFDSCDIVSPADGRVVDVQPEGNFEGYDQKISIFLSPLDVHVNWTPIEGIIREVNYKPGKYLMAFEPKSSELNERNDIIIEDSKNRKILIRQIAGFIARRIVCWVNPEERVSMAQKYGMIKFGSRIDILLPRSVKLNVEVGQRVYGGQTVIGRWVC